jgi:hypothetical protein
MATDGRRDLVDRVAAANNNVWVAELAGDSAFNAWLEDAGITLGEAARIQVPYEGGEGPPNFREVSPGTSNSYLVTSTLATTGALATTLVNATMNRRGESRLNNVLGLVAGAASLTVGIAGVRSPDEAPTVASVASALAGATSIGFSTRSLLRRNHTMAARRAAERMQASRATVAPIVSMDGKAAAGMSLSIPF